MWILVSEVGFGITGFCLLQDRQGDGTKRGTDDRAPVGKTGGGGGPSGRGGSPGSCQPFEEEMKAGQEEKKAHQGKADAEAKDRQD
jgi:hypothetical protein